jgi:uncharacterized protein
LSNFATIFLRTRLAPAILLLAMLPACATFRSYDSELTRTINLVSAGNVDGAIKQLDSNNRRSDKDLLYYLELGELQRLNHRYDESEKAWLAADGHVQAWENTAMANPEKVLGSITSVLVNDKTIPYEGHDYEKVMLTTRLALDRLARGDFDMARVDIKRTHEREAIIAELREKELKKTEDEARKHGVRTGFKELNGYPVQTIDNPEINALKNSYENAFSHYLAGFVYEALGEPSLAAAGYRHAIELQPGRPLLEDALAGLDTRVMVRDDGYTDVLFVLESGVAPARKSRQFNLPIPYRDRLLFVPVSFPVIAPTQPAFMPSGLQITGEAAISTTLLTSVDLMARKALQEEMPGIMLRGMIRSTSKAAAQYQASKNSNQSGLVALAGLAVTIGTVVTESADERGWRSLPSQIAIARLRIPSGEHTLAFGANPGGQGLRFSVSGRYAVISLRLIGNAAFLIPSPVVPSEKSGTQASNPLPLVVQSTTTASKTFGQP